MGWNKGIKVMFLLSYCRVDDKYRHFHVLGLYTTLEAAKADINLEDEFHHAIDEFPDYKTLPTHKVRVYQDW